MEANEGKELTVEVDGRRFERIPIETPLVLAGDDLDAIVRDHAGPVVRRGDVVFVTEKIVAITQGRSWPLESIEPRRLARVLARRVQRTPHGIGLGMPETMEMALRECGTPRILAAAAAAAVTKSFGRKGDFYRVAGEKARGIDGPTQGTIPPYDGEVVLVPVKPESVARRLRDALGVDVAVVDINDLGGNILGSTLDRAGERRLVEILADNPLGQGRQSTPLGVVRAV